MVKKELVVKIIRGIIISKIKDMIFWFLLGSYVLDINYKNFFSLGF